MASYRRSGGILLVLLLLILVGDSISCSLLVFQHYIVVVGLNAVNLVCKEDFPTFRPRMSD